MSQDCSEIQELVPLYAVNALDDADARQVDEHIQTCPACREVAEDYRKCFWCQEVASTDEATSGQVRRAMAGVRRRIRVRRTARWAFRAAAALGAAACLLIVLGRPWTELREPESRGEPAQKAERTTGAQSGTDAGETAGASMAELAGRGLGLPATGVGAVKHAKESGNRQTGSPPQALSESRRVLGKAAHFVGLETLNGKQARAFSTTLTTALARHLHAAPSSEDIDEFLQWQDGLRTISGAAGRIADCEDTRARSRANRILYECLSRLGESGAANEALLRYLVALSDIKGRAAAESAAIAAANGMISAGTHMQALDLFDKLLSWNSSTEFGLRIQYLVGVIYASSGRTDDALRQLQDVMRNGVGTLAAVRAAKSANEMLANRGQYASALEVIQLLEDELALSEADTKHAKLRRAMIAVMAERSADAVKSFQAILREYADDPSLVRIATNAINTIRNKELNAVER